MVKINVPKHESNASAILDWVRFLAALLVFGLHLTGNSIIPGYQAVMVFFVISGYFISSTVLRMIMNDKWSWKYYLICRLTRLWVVLVPALILSAIWIYIEIKIFGSSNSLSTFRGGTVGSVSISSFIQNLLFLQGVTTPELFGNNGPLWSLSFEFWYYMLFPIMILAFRSKTNKSRILYGITFIFLVVFLGKHIISYYVIWLLGTLIAVMQPSEIVRKFPRTFLYLSSILAGVSLQALYYLLHIGRPFPDMAHYVPDLSVGVCFAFFVYVINNLFSCSNSMKLAKKWGAYLGGMSYTLYLVHFPVINFLKTWHIMVAHNIIKKLVIYVCISAFILIYSWLISCITERQTTKIKNWILNIGRHSFDLKKTA